MHTVAVKLKNLQEDIKTVFMCRFVSLTITTLFYIFGDSVHSIKRKLFVAACITLSSAILQYLYTKNWNFKMNVIILIIIETIGNTILLIPSGGINSPYLWHSLNTILIASLKLNKWMCWLNICVYLSTSFTVLGLELNGNNRNYVLSLVLIAVAIQILAKYIRQIDSDKTKLEKSNILLRESNNKVKETVSYIVELYQAVDVLTAEKDRRGLVNLIAEYTKKITRSATVVFYCLSGGKDDLIVLSDEDDYDDNEKIQRYLEVNLTKIVQSEDSFSGEIAGRKFTLVPIKSNAALYGVVGAEISCKGKTSCGLLCEEQLNFVSNLGTIVLDRLELEKVNEELIINQEQNRIADEIHDSVLQRLFSASCGIYSVLKSNDKYLNGNIERELNDIRSVIDYAMKDLRRAIYDISWKKDGESEFKRELKRYVDDVERLNKVNVNLQMSEVEGILTCQQKKILYRVICEGISNALRHGKAKNIDVGLDVFSNEIYLSIVDDGVGFDSEEPIISQSTGMGMKNMRYLINSLRGELFIKSEVHKGTEIKAKVPNGNTQILEEGII